MAPMEIAYAAHTDTCSFLLDENGICRRVVPRGNNAVPETAAQCVGAQYLAALDATVEGYLVAVPRVGSPMLFGMVQATGRIAVVRTGRVIRFEDRRRLSAVAMQDSGDAFTRSTSAVATTRAPKTTPPPAPVGRGVPPDRGSETRDVGVKPREGAPRARTNSAFWDTDENTAEHAVAKGASKPAAGARAIPTPPPPRAPAMPASLRRTPLPPPPRVRVPPAGASVSPPAAAPKRPLVRIARRAEHG
ncbi:MAG: hypothetical protein U0169_11390 [Polyangiaceae bacterium]